MKICEDILFLQIAFIKLTRGYQICVLQIWITCIQNTYQSPDFDSIGLVEAWDSELLRHSQATLMWLQCHLSGNLNYSKINASNITSISPLVETHA